MATAQVQPTYAELQARVAQLEAQRDARIPELSFRVSPKGGVSVYGLGRFPVTLYASQWVRLLAAATRLLAFITANKSVLATKE